jgi:hypothetical protein
MEGSLSLFSASSLTNCSILLPTASASASASASLSLSHPHFSYDYPLKFPHLSQRASPNHALSFPFSPSSSSSSTATTTCQRSRSRHANFISKCSTSSSRKAELEFESSSSQPVDDGGDLDCVGTGLDSECLVSEPNLDAPLIQLSSTEKGETATESLIETITETAVLVSPFFFWGTSMVAMKEVLRLTGPFFVSSFRLIPAGLLLVAFAGFKGRPLPSGLTAWLTITLFALVDASCFQVFTHESSFILSFFLNNYVINCNCNRGFLLKDCRGLLLVWVVYVSFLFCLVI